MKKKSYLLILLLAASVIFTGCRTDDSYIPYVPDPDPPPPTEYIEVANPDALEQTVYADEEVATSTVEFTTLAPWESSIDVPPTTTATRSATDWVSISPESGGIGEYEITITLTPNTTGTDRSVIITITSGGSSITITITQRYVREDGTILLPNQVDAGVVIDGIRWATRNVDAPGTFVDNPEDTGMFFQWNRRVGWSSTDPLINSEGGTVWDSSVPEGAIWERENDPCPQGWRVPSVAELQSLAGSYSEWTTQNGVDGRLFGIAPYQIFLPNVNHRRTDGALETWMTVYQGAGGFLSLDSWGIRVHNTTAGRWGVGANIRCVEDIYIPIESIAINKTTITLPAGSSIPDLITVTVLPANATYRDIAWGTNNWQVAQMLEEMWAILPGVAILTATTEDASHTVSIEVTVTGKTEPTQGGVIINGIEWATRNVDAPGTFTENPEDFGMFFQWNRRAGWSFNSPVASDGSDVWNFSAATGTRWYAENDPCPEGWQVPTIVALRSLSLSNQWAGDWATVNGVNGAFFGSEPNQIFLPAAGGFVNGNHILSNMGLYWSSSGTIPNTMNLNRGAVSLNSTNQDIGFSIRCMAK